MKYHSHKAPPSIDLKNLPTFVSFSSAKSRVLSLLMTFPTSKLQVVVFFPKNTWFRALYRENRLSNNYLCEPPCICCQYVSGNRWFHAAIFPGLVAAAGKTLLACASEALWQEAAVTVCVGHLRGAPRRLTHAEEQGQRLRERMQEAAVDTAQAVWGFFFSYFDCAGNRVMHFYIFLLCTV